MSRLRALAALPLAAGAAGCVYLNGLYNAESAFDRAEQAQLLGRDSAALAGWAEAEQKAERSWLKEPEGRWADRSRYVLGRARLRRGDFAGARAALEPVRAGTADPALRARATLYLGAVAVANGDQEQAIPLLTEALATVEPASLRAEGHLWRARLFLSMGLVDQGWWDLDRAGQADDALRVPAALERVTWGVVHGDPVRAAEGASALLLAADGAGRADTLAALVRAEAAQAGPAAAARLLDSVPVTAWSAAARDRALLLRAGLHLSAADTGRALADATRVAEAPASRADAGAARLFVARVALARVARADQLEDLRALLLPVVDDPVVRRLLESAAQLELLAERGGRGEPLAVFAAGEVARDALAAPALAAALFLAYADAAPAPLWRGKALLAALSVSPEGAAREQIRRRAAALASDPYVSVALGGVAGQPAYEELERELREQLGGLLADVTAEVRLRDVVVRAPADSVAAGGLR